MVSDLECKAGKKYKNVTISWQQLRDTAVKLSVCVCVCLCMCVRAGITVGFQLALRASIRPELGYF